MTEEYGILDGRLTALEARLAGSVAEPMIGATHAEAGLPFTELNDPKGRKPWEAYWDAENHSMMIFVPTGALIAGGSAVEVNSDEAQQEGNAFKVGAGEWSLQVERTEEGWKAKLKSSEGETGEGRWNIKIAKIVGDEGDEVAEQYVSSVIVIDEGGTIEEPEAVAESVEPDEEAEASVEVVEASEEKPKHLKFSFKIPKGKAGEEGKDGDQGKSIERAELVNAGCEGAKWWTLDFYREEEETPITIEGFIGIRDSDKELFIGGVDTGIQLDSEDCIKKTRNASQNLFTGGNGIGFGTSENYFRIQGTSANHLEINHEQNGQLLDIPDTIDSVIAVKRRRLKVSDASNNGSAADGEVTIGYGSIEIDRKGGAPSLSFRQNGILLASLAINSNSKKLYLNSSEYGMVLNGPAGQTNLSNKPTAKLASAGSANNQMISIGWIVDNLQELKLNGVASGVKVLSTSAVDIKQKQLIEGNGIKLTEEKDGIRIEATAASGCEMQGEIVYVYDVMYDVQAHMLKKLMAQTNVVTGKTTYGSNRATTAEAGTWVAFSGGAQTVPYS